MRTFAVVLLCFVVAVSAWPNKRTLDAEIRELSDHLLVDMLEARAGTHSRGPGGASKLPCEDGDEDVSFEVPEGCTTDCHTCTFVCVDNESGESGEYEYRPSTNNPDECHRAGTHSGGPGGDRPEKPDHDHSCEAGEKKFFPPGCHEDTNADICCNIQCVDGEFEVPDECKPCDEDEKYFFPEDCDEEADDCLFEIPCEQGKLQPICAVLLQAQLDEPCEHQFFPPGCRQTEDRPCLARCENDADGYGQWSIIPDLPVPVELLAEICPGPAVKRGDHACTEGTFPRGCDKAAGKCLIVIPCQNGQHVHPICDGRAALAREAKLNVPCGDKTAFPPGCGQNGKPCLARCVNGGDDGNGKWSIIPDLPADLLSNFCPAQAAAKKNDHSIDESRLEEMLRNLKHMMEEEKDAVTDETKREDSTVTDETKRDEITEDFVDRDDTTDASMRYVEITEDFVDRDDTTEASKRDDETTDSPDERMEERLIELLKILHQ